MAENKILVVMDGFFPGLKYGGPPVSVNNFCSLMCDYDIYIVARNHDLNSQDKYTNIADGWNKRDNCTVKYFADSEYNYSSFKAVIDEIKPDFIYLQSLFQSCVIPCLYIAKKKGIKVILAPRGELCKGAFRKKYKKIPYILFLRIFDLVKNINFQSTSEEESACINKYLKANSENIHLLSNIPSCPKCDFPDKIKLSGSADFIFLSRIHPKKNLKSAISYFRNIKGNVNFHIYGPVEDTAYWNECKDEIKKLPENIKVSYCGLVSFENVHKTFNKYDGFIFPTLSENFGHVIAESLYSNCPVIISDQTPWNDIPQFNAGFVVSLNNEKGFEEAIQCIVDSNSAAFRNNAKNYILQKLNLESLYSAYKRLFV